LGFKSPLMVAVSERDLLEFGLGVGFGFRLFGGLCFLNFLISVLIFDCLVHAHLLADALVRVCTHDTGVG